MSKNKLTTGFKSLLYRSGFVYNFVNQRGYEFKKKFKTIATIVCSNGAKKVLDLPCGTGYLTRYLDPDVIYEGWDLNRKFLTKIRFDSLFQYILSEISEYMVLIWYPNSKFILFSVI